MLILHPTSTCDVCLERYAWDATSAESKPHVISCGHVFCHQCLQNLVARTCPLCRKPFHLSRAVRVHIDLTTEDMSYVLTADEVEARQYEGRILRAAGDDVMDENCQTTIEEAVEWLRERSPTSHPNLRSAVSLLRRYKALQEEVQGAREDVRSARSDRDAYKRALKQKMRESESDKVLHRGVSENWSTRVTELTADYEKKLIEAETRRRSIEDEFRRFKSAMSAQLQSHAEAYATSQAQLQAQIQQARARAESQSQSQGAGQATSSITFPRASSPSEMPYEISYKPQNNPLPRPPEPIPLSMLPDFARPASRSYREGERRERRKEREREKDRHRERDRDRDTDRDRDRDRDRERRRRHRDGIRERVAMTDREACATETHERRLRKSRLSFSEAGPLPDIPRDVIGGWGLERTWRASLNGSNADLSRQPSTSELGSSRVTVTVTRPREKGKTRERVRERERDRGEYANVESASEHEGEYVFVEHSAQEDRDKKVKEREREKERERRHRDRRSSLGMGHASSSSRLRPRDRERDRDRTAESSRETRDRERARDPKDREARRSTHTLITAPAAVSQTQVVPVPVPVPVSVSSSYIPTGSNAAQQSALGLILVPSPDGKGYEYRYAQIQSSMDSAHTVVFSPNQGQLDVQSQPITIAPSFASSSYSYNNYSNSSSDGGVRALTAAAYSSYAPTQASTGRRSPHHVRRATDPVIPGQAYETSLHVPQPRRISTHIPEVDPTPEPSSAVSPGVSTAVPQTQTMPPILSLDAAIAQLHLAQPQAPASVSVPQQQPVPESSVVRMELTPSQQELKHKRSGASTLSNASTGISLTGSTSGERRKQLLDALFPSMGRVPDAASQPSAPGLPGTDGRPQSTVIPSQHQQQQATQPSLHVRQSTYPPVTFSSNNPYSAYYQQQPNAASSASLTSTYVEPVFPGGYASVEAAQAWTATGGETRERLKTDNAK